MAQKGPTGPAGAGSGATGPTAPTGAMGPSTDAVLGYVPRSANTTLAAGETKTVEIKCPDNTATVKYLTSGGGFVAFIDEVHNQASYQTADGPGWHVEAHNNSAQIVVVEARVVCLRINTGN